MANLVLILFAVIATLAITGWRYRKRAMYAEDGWRDANDGLRHFHERALLLTHALIEHNIDSVIEILTSSTNNLPFSEYMGTCIEYLGQNPTFITGWIRDSEHARLLLDKWVRTRTPYKRVAEILAGTYFDLLVGETEEVSNPDALWYRLDAIEDTVENFGPDFGGRKVALKAVLRRLADKGTTAADAEDIYKRVFEHKFDDLLEEFRPKLGPLLLKPAVMDADEEEAVATE